MRFRLSPQVFVLLVALSSCERSSSLVPVGDASGVDQTSHSDGTDAAITDAHVAPDGRPTRAIQAVRDTRALPSSVRRAATDLAEARFSDGITLQVRSGSTLSEEDKNEFHSRAARALLYDLEALHLDPSDVVNVAIQLVVLDTRAYDLATESPGTYGVSFPANGRASDAMVVPENAISNLEELDDTLAHELVHILQGRAAPNGDVYPWYFIEGSAINVASHYNYSIYGRVSSFVVSYLAATADDARTTFTRYSFEDNTTTLAQIGHDQSVSGFFVEYLRTKHGGAGIPDINAKLVRVYTSSRSAATFQAAFQTEVGESIDSAQAAFIAFMGTGTRTTRWRGTVFE